MRIIGGATGLIGKRLVDHWLKQKHAIIAVGRTREHIAEVFGNKVTALTWDELTTDLLQPAEVVVNLAGANVASKRWTEERKQEIYSSRINSTQKLTALLAPLGKNSPPLFNASAVGIYGLQNQIPNALPPALAEDAPIDWDNPPDFFARLARNWEKTAVPAIDAGVRVVFLRFGVVLAAEGGALPKIAFPYKFYLGGTVGKGDQPFPWIALPDVIRAIDFLLSKPDAAGPYNLVAPEGVSQRALAKNLAEVTRSYALVPMPEFAVSLLLGKEMAEVLLLEGQHVYPKRLLDLGFHFAYPDLDSALRNTL